MKKPHRKTSLGTTILLITIGVALLFYLDWKVYRAAHPDAPVWTYFFK